MAAILDVVKLALRITTGYFDAELTDLIDAAQADLTLCGVNAAEKQDDPLIKRAVVLYCKAHFGADDNAGRYQQSYDMLKGSLMIAGDYRVES
ncbi:head-tail connector protein [Oscillospiraceae bacterium LTW-04]|nr:head-tail connector protein [Oscillospiraceae bacterium MB24-C1]